MRIELATNKMVRPKGCLVMIDNTLSRLFKGLPQLPVKWRAFIRNNELHVYHYHHLVIIYDLKTKIYKHTWWELPADKRIRKLQDLVTRKQQVDNYNIIY